jgi:hypothetical protein
VLTGIDQLWVADITSLLSKTILNHRSRC